MQKLKTKQKVSVILIFVSIVLFITSFLVYNTISDDYTIAKGDKVTEEWLRMGLFDDEDIPDILYSLQNSKAKELPQLETKINMCIAGIIVSLLICTVGLIVLVQENTNTSKNLKHYLF